MSRQKILYQCQSCGYTSPKWLGKCSDCGAWNSFVEETRFTKLKKQETAAPVVLSEVTHSTGERHSTGIKEFDRTLGGGIVLGSVVLIGGDPGIGKSTLLMQAFKGLAKLGKTLYVSGEESPEQIKIRADRLKVKSDNIILLPETSLEGIISVAHEISPKAIVIDSIQTIFSLELPSAPGSVGQIRECATKLMFFAKRYGIPLFIIGHVTKEGAIAGPRVLEHIVDTVLYFEGDRGHAYRILRTVKNRFGSTNEIGVFEMSDSGLREIENPSELFLLERPLNVSGSTVVGGLRIIEPAVDLGIISTIASSLRDIFIDPKTFVFGEIGLSGEIRAIAQAEIRIKEASKIGFKKAVMPLGNADKIKGSFGLEIIGVKDVESALEAVLT